MDEYQKAVNEANAALRDLEREINDKIRAATLAIRREYSDATREAEGRLSEARQALRAHIDATSSHPWDGKRVFRIVPTNNRWSSKKTGEVREDGVVEVVRTTSKFPQNMNGSRPRLGEVIVRKVKTNDEPSLQFHRYPGNIMKEWSLVP